MYRGENIEENCKSVAFSLLYRHEDRTLTDEEVNQVHGEIVRALETGFAAKLRES